MTGITARAEVLTKLEKNNNFMGSFEQTTIDVTDMREAYNDSYGRVYYLVCRVFNPDINFYDKVYIIDNTKQLTLSHMGFLDLLADYNEVCNVKFARTVNVNFGLNRVVKMTLEKCLVILIKKNYTK